MLKTKEHLILGFLIFLHLFLRFYKIGQIPYGFHRDEASVGYNAYSILKTGKDEWGKTLPLFFRAFGDYPPALILYVTIPFIAVLGLTELSVKLPLIVFSLLSFIFVYLILKKLKLEKGLIYTFLLLLATSPWEITQTRSSSEVILGSSLFLMGLYYLIKFFEDKKVISFTIFYLSWFLTYFSYNSFRIQIPLLVLPVIFLVWQKKIKYKKFIIPALFLLFLFPWLMAFIFKGVGVRGKDVLLIFDPSVKDSLEALSYQSALMKSPFFLTRFFHNKVSYFIFSLVKNTLRLLSFEFLYVFEAIPRRYSVPENGLFLFITAPFLVLGIIFFGLKKIQFRSKLIFLASILIGFFPSIITTNDFPNSRRCFLALYPLIYLISLGIYLSYQKIKKAKIKGLYSSMIVLLLVLNFGYFWYFYQFHSSFIASHSRNYFYKQIVQAIEKYKQTYSSFKIYSYSDQPYIFNLFYTKYSPADYQQWSKDNLPENLFSLKKDWSFGQYIFTLDECPLPEENQLVFSEKSKCQRFFDEDERYNKVNILGYTYSPFGREEFVYYAVPKKTPDF